MGDSAVLTARLAERLLATFAYATPPGAAFLRRVRPISAHNSSPPVQSAPATDFEVTVRRTVRDIDENSAHVIQAHYSVAKDESFNATTKWSWRAGPSHIAARAVNGSKASLFALSPSGVADVTFFNSPLKKTGTGGTAVTDPHASYVEIRHGCPHIGHFRRSLADFHGKIVGDAWFGGSSFSPCGRYVAYVALVKPAKTTSGLEAFATSKSASKEEDKCTDELQNRFAFQDDWGEKYVDVSETAIFVLDTQTGIVTPLPGIDKNEFTVGQPTLFTHPENPKELWVAYNAWDVKPYRVGMIYCYHRASSVFVQRIVPKSSATEETPSETSTPIRVTTGLQFTRSPRISPDQKTLVFLGRKEKLSAHNGYADLYAVDISTLLEQGGAQGESVWMRRVTTAPESVSVQGSSDITFPGIYTDALTTNCFSSSGDRVYIDTQWGNANTLVSVDLKSGEVTRVNLQIDETPLTGQTVALLDIADDVALFGYASPVSPWKLATAYLKDINSAGDLSTNAGPSTPRLPITATPVESVPLFRDNAVMWESFTWEKDGVPMGSILLRPTAESATPRPLIVVPHGGPHSGTLTSFLPAYFFLARFLGVGILHVNYRGSTGFGEASIRSLLGNIGTNDVEDMVDSLDRALTLKNESGDSLFDAQRVGIVGGSHGGFLGAHLCGQFPDRFHVAALRNPVTNIPSMVGVSDIADWCHVESVGESESTSQFPGPCSPETLARMLSVSPISHLSTYRAPTLLCMGAKDRRVPPSQGREFFSFLLSKGVDAQMLWFPEDTHALDNPITESEHWIAIASHISSHLNIDISAV